MNQSQIYLDRLKTDDVTEDYVNWLNDPVINQYLESRYIKHDIGSVKLFVEAMSQDNKNFLFGMFCRKTFKHIGNIKLGPIDYRYKRADIGLIVGDKNYWGKGIATEAIALLTDFAANDLNLHKLEAGCYTSNIGSLKAFLKEGYLIEGTLKEHVKLDGKWEDCYRLGKVVNNDTKDKV